MNLQERLTNHHHFSSPASSAPLGGASPSPARPPTRLSSRSSHGSAQMLHHKGGHPQCRHHHQMPLHPILRASGRYVGSTTLLGQYLTHRHHQIPCLEPRRKMAPCWQHNPNRPPFPSSPLTFLVCDLGSEMLVSCEVDLELSRAV